VGSESDSSSNIYIKWYSWYLKDGKIIDVIWRKGKKLLRSFSSLKQVACEYKKICENLRKRVC
jgi:hypothetical protein